MTVAPPSHGLVAQGLCARAGRRDVLSRVSFTVEPGEVLAIVGPNGSGKTTLLECLAGLRPLIEGHVTEQGRALTSFRDRANVFAYMPDEVVLPGEGPIKTMLGLDRDAPLVDAMSVTSLLGRRASELSRGEAKRALLCATLLENKPALLLDEPFAAFDPRQLRALLPVFRDATRGRITLVTVHQMRTAELIATRVLLLAEGRMVALGTPDELRHRVGLRDGPFDDVFLALLEQEPTQ